MITSIIFGVLCIGIVICTLILTETLKKYKLSDFLFSCFAITAMSIFAIQCPIFPWSVFNKINTNTTFDTYYLEAEPLAHNQTQTVFTTDEGTYITNGLYPDGTYLLTVDGDTVLVVWQAVEGEEVGLG